MRDFLLIARALADETRARIMKLLEGEELCVCDIMKILDMPQSTASKHLGILHLAGLVERRKYGTWSFYRLTDSTVNRYNLIFTEILKEVLNDDRRIEEDRKRLRQLKRSLKSCK